MPGIYIHIPFCKQACHYCDFHFSTLLKYKDAFIDALIGEIRLRKDFFGPKNNVSTVYFGGGTPSLLSGAEINQIIGELQKFFKMDGDVEITLEANPDDLTEKKINELKQTGVNRLSIGIQSFFDEDLQLMNRAHNAKEATDSVRLAQKNGFKNITIDLIYGLPLLTNDRWQENLKKAFALDVQHISCYHLTVEEKTALHDMVKKNKVVLLPEEKSVEQFGIMTKAMHENGFIQYEISNFCNENFYSRHNSAYWKKELYLGLGPSAHSYNGIARMWNVSNNNTYIKGVKEGKLQMEEEILSVNQKYNEYIMTTLRTMWGSDLQSIKHEFGENVVKHVLGEGEKYFSSGHLINRNNKLFLSEEGKLIADRIASDLFLVD